MFLDNGLIERTTLRQGDIISQIHLLGAINLHNINYSYQELNSETLTNWSIQLPPIIGDAMVLPHSCEVALENRVKLTSIILAPLRNINTATDPTRIQELIESNLIDRGNPQHSFLKYFYIEPNQALEHSEGAVVDFSKIFSVRKQSYESLLEKKVAQLSVEATASMALKLGLYFHRAGELGQR